MNEYVKRHQCAVCESKNLKKILDLGKVPLAGNFPKKEELKNIKTYQLNLMECRDCGLIQTDLLISPDILFKDYRYISSVGLKGHFENVAKMLTKKFKLKGKSVLEFGCNDGVLLKPLKDLGVKVLGIDPAKNIVKIARDKGLEVIRDYFNSKTATKYGMKEKFDMVIANNTFAHISDIKDTLRGVKYALKKDGMFVFEVHYLKDIVELNQWDSIYHEHIYYYSVRSVNNFMKMFGMTLVDFEEFPIHSGSIRFYVKNKVEKQAKKIMEKIEEEKELYKKLSKFGEKTKKHIESIQKFIKKLKAEKKKIIGYGASGRGNMFCNIVGLTNKDIDYIVDESPERYGRYIPKANIPIISKEQMKYDADYVFIIAWNYKEMIMDKLKGNKFKYIVAFPKIKIPLS